TARRTKRRGGVCYTEPCGSVYSRSTCSVSRGKNYEAGAKLDWDSHPGRIPHIEAVDATDRDSGRLTPRHRERGIRRLDGIAGVVDSNTTGAEPDSITG